MLIALEREGLSMTQIARRLNRKHQSIIGRLASLARREAVDEIKEERKSKLNHE